MPPQESGARSVWSHLQQNWFGWSSLWVEPGKEKAARRRKNGLPIFSCVQRKSILTMDLEGPGPLAVLALGAGGGSVAWGSCWDLPLLKQFPAYKVAVHVESPLRRGYANEWCWGFLSLAKCSIFSTCYRIWMQVSWIQQWLTVICSEKWVVIKIVYTELKIFHHYFCTWFFPPFESLREFENSLIRDQVRCDRSRRKTLFDFVVLYSTPSRPLWMLLEWINYLRIY